MTLTKISQIFISWDTFDMNKVNEEKRKYIQVKDNALFLSDTKETNSLQKIVQFMHDYAKTLNPQILTVKEKKKLTTISKKLTKILDAYQKKEQEWIAARGFLRRVLHAVYTIFFGLSQKMQRTIDLLNFANNVAYTISEKQSPSQENGAKREGQIARKPPTLETLSNTTDADMDTLGKVFIRLLA